MSKKQLSAGWKHGPLPPNTYGWGGVVEFAEVESETSYDGFQFADFQGDHVVLPMDNDRRLDAHKIAAYNNSLVSPCLT